MEVDIFLQGLYNFNTEKYYVVYPDEVDLDDYALSLESKFYNMFDEKLDASYISFREYNKYKKKWSFDDDIFVIDPLCMQYKFNKLKKTLESAKAILGKENYDFE